MRRDISRLWLLPFAVCLAHAQPVALSVNISSREEVRQFYRAVYHASEGVPMNWTGSYVSGNAGDTSAAFKEATRLRINFYRALVGIPADLTFNATYNSKAQQAALLMSLNDALSHTPPPTWAGYTAIAAEAAGNSNLALGNAGPDAISGYMADSGDNNAFVGHRRWLIYPQTLQMGTGDTPGIPGNPARRATNAVWVFDGQIGAARPTTRTAAVPYPPAGFIPHQLVWPRWSFSHPEADFTAASVALTRDGQSVSARLEPIGNNIGEPTLVWVYNNLDPENPTIHPRPAQDTTYTVNVNNVRVRGAAQNFVYQVTVFDPDVPSGTAAPIRITGASLPAVGTASHYTVVKPSFATGFEWRTVQVTPVARTFTAESGLEDLIATTSAGYEVVQSATVASGSRAYRLAQSSARSDEILRLPGTYLADADSMLTFRSRLGIATAIENARVQVSSDDGRTWMDVFSQSGTSPTDTNMPAPTEPAFVTRTISLAAHAGRTLSVRLVYSAGPGIAFIPTPANTVGWFIDDLTLTKVGAVIANPTTRVASGNTFAFTPDTPGAVRLQARGLMFEAYPMDWGEIVHLNAISGNGSGNGSAGTGYLSNLSVSTGAGSEAQTLIVGFAIGGGAKRLLVRGAGPALSVFGVSDVLGDPKLELYRDTMMIAGNDNWLAADSATFGSVGAFGFADNSRDSSLVVSLQPGSYTAQVSGVAGGTGRALVELYDAAASGIAEGRLTNVSARSQIGVGNETLIAGFNIAGSESRTLLIRAVGPTLAGFGVDGALDDPRLELFGREGRIQENDNWDVVTRSAFARVGAFELAPNSRDAVLVVTLPPGSYTAHVSGVNGASGVALVEVYEVP